MTEMMNRTTPCGMPKGVGGGPVVFDDDRLDPGADLTVPSFPWESARTIDIAELSARKVFADGVEANERDVVDDHGPKLGRVGERHQVPCCQSHKPGSQSGVRINWHNPRDSAHPGHKSDRNWCCSAFGETTSGSPLKPV